MSIDFKVWGRQFIDDPTMEQMKQACELPISVKASLMPDAHLGYGLPIGGVLATDNCVIPFAVGVDIACRLMMSVIDIPPNILDDINKIKSIIENETRFGVGANFQNKRQHHVMDMDWNICDITKQNKDMAWTQLGTSGGGNHFCDIGLVQSVSNNHNLPIENNKQYVAIITHSGSRGTGHKIANHYSKLAESICTETPTKHLAWLNLDTQEGKEYWDAMELMGEYASANHHCIHDAIINSLGAQSILQIENHHNFAWKETHTIFNDQMEADLVVHRKGATPASKGELGIIPGSMTTATYIVSGRGVEDSLRSSSHGAGRLMSRTKAKQQLSFKDVEQICKDNNINILSAGLDELTGAYKNIEEVLEAQDDLVEKILKFSPRFVKMSGLNEKPED